MNSLKITSTPEYKALPKRFKDNKLDKLTVTPDVGELKPGNFMPNAHKLSTVLFSLDYIDQLNDSGLQYEIPDATRKAFVKQLLKENSNAMFIIGVREAFDGENAEALTAISVHKRFGIPYKNMIITNNERSVDWAEDPFTTKLDKSGHPEILEPAGGYFKNTNLAEGVSKLTKLPVVQSTHRNGGGGDQEVIQLPKGRQAVAFGIETLRFTIIDKSILSSFPKDEEKYLLRLGSVMKSYLEDGIELGNQIIVGSNENKNKNGQPLTIGNALAKLTLKQKDILRAEIGDKVYTELEKRGKLPLPIDGSFQSNMFHIDLYSRFIANNKGDISGVVADIKNTNYDEEVVASLQAQGIKIARLPQIEPPPITSKEHLRLINPEIPADPDLIKKYKFTNYTNGEIIKDHNNKTVYFMPTESLSSDYENLSEQDKKAFKTLQEIFPEAEIRPVGGESAKLSYEFGGLNCLTQFLPINVKVKD